MTVGNTLLQEEVLQLKTECAENKKLAADAMRIAKEALEQVAILTGKSGTSSTTDADARLDEDEPLTRKGSYAPSKKEGDAPAEQGGRRGSRPAQVLIDPVPVEEFDAPIKVPTPPAASKGFLPGISRTSSSSSVKTQAAATPKGTSTASGSLSRSNSGVGAKTAETPKGTSSSSAARLSRSNSGLGGSKKSTATGTGSLSRSGSMRRPSVSHLTPKGSFSAGATSLASLRKKQRKSSQDFGASKSKDEDCFMQEMGLEHTEGFAKKVQELVSMMAASASRDTDANADAACDETLGLKKLDLAKQLLLGNACVTTAAGRTEVISLVDALVKQGDDQPGNAQLVEAFLRQVTSIDWAKEIKAGDWTLSAIDGSHNYLDTFLSLPGVQVDTMELIEASFFNQSCRIPCALVLMKHSDDGSLDWTGNLDQIQPLWQDFFEDVAAESRAILKEERTGKLELLGKMLDHPLFDTNIHRLGADGETCYTRACEEGDLDVVQLFVARNLVDLTGLTD